MTSPPRCIAPLKLASTRASLPLTSIQFARHLDEIDSLSTLRQEYIIPGQDKGGIYFSAHALGAQPRGARDLLEEELENWGMK